MRPPVSFWTRGWQRTLGQKQASREPPGPLLLAMRVPRSSLVVTAPTLELAVNYANRKATPRGKPGSSPNVNNRWITDLLLFKRFFWRNTDRAARRPESGDD